MVFSSPRRGSPGPRARASRCGSTRARHALRIALKPGAELLEKRCTPTGNIVLTGASVVNSSDQPLSTIDVGELVYIQANFTTQGLPSTAAYVVGYTVNGLTRDSSTIAYGAGGSGTGSWYEYWGNFVATAGTNQVTVDVDPAESVPETTYADNTIGLPRTCNVAAPRGLSKG